MNPLMLFPILSVAFASGGYSNFPINYGNYHGYKNQGGNYGDYSNGYGGKEAGKEHRHYGNGYSLGGYNGHDNEYGRNNYEYKDGYALGEYDHGHKLDREANGHKRYGYSSHGLGPQGYYAKGYYASDGYDRELHKGGTVKDGYGNGYKNGYKSNEHGRSLANKAYRENEKNAGDYGRQYQSGGYANRAGNFGNYGGDGGYANNVNFGPYKSL